MQQYLQYWNRKMWLKARLSGKVNPCLYQPLAWEAAGSSSMNHVHPRRGGWDWPIPTHKCKCERGSRVRFWWLSPAAGFSHWPGHGGDRASTSNTGEESSLRRNLTSISGTWVRFISPHHPETRAGSRKKIKGTAF